MSLFAQVTSAVRVTMKFTIQVTVPPFANLPFTNSSRPSTMVSSSSFNNNSISSAAMTTLYTPIPAQIGPYATANPVYFPWGGSFSAGTSVVILWGASTPGTIDVGLEYLSDSSITNKIATIALGIPNTGSISWIVPQGEKQEECQIVLKWGNDPTSDGSWSKQFAIVNEVSSILSTIPPNYSPTSTMAPTTVHCTTETATSVVSASSPSVVKTSPTGSDSSTTITEVAAYTSAPNQKTTSSASSTPREPKTTQSATSWTTSVPVQTSQSSPATTTSSLLSSSSSSSNSVPKHAGFSQTTLIAAPTGMTVGLLILFPFLIWMVRRWWKRRQEGGEESSQESGYQSNVPPPYDRERIIAFEERRQRMGDVSSDSSSG